jgi:hypothetical protein
MSASGMSRTLGLAMAILVASTILGLANAGQRVVYQSGDWRVVEFFDAFGGKTEGYTSIHRNNEMRFDYYFKNDGEDKLFVMYKPNIFDFIEIQKEISLISKDIKYIDHSDRRRVYAVMSFSNGNNIQSLSCAYGDDASIIIKSDKIFENLSHSSDLVRCIDSSCKFSDSEFYFFMTTDDANLLLEGGNLHVRVSFVNVVSSTGRIIGKYDLGPVSLSGAQESLKFMIDNIRKVQ